MGKNERSVSGGDWPVVWWRAMMRHRGATGSSVPVGDKEGSGSPGGAGKGNAGPDAAAGRQRGGNAHSDTRVEARGGEAGVLAQRTRDSPKDRSPLGHRSRR
ncbi:hypothetical protein Ade02nite_79650 [Paractinoplanes deccanensis]|uniref:Uncharacterized protein n=1 Tax=Paractinoplanes deccanensis TaxID=113561 RepID=A0ABQ3YH76_9ACTN|nr:hypothetical protein Ade02nite_79650 [Actinoplanes deccanensis]